MKLPFLASCVAAAIVLAATHLVAADQKPPALPPLHVQDGHMVNAEGRPVVLKGTNLGNWLVIETWMLAWSDVPDQHTILETLRSRFGRDEGDRLLSVYRDNYITQRDFDNIKSLGFNLVRLPLGWDNIQTEEAPYGLRPDAFKYIDRAVDMAEKAGMYVILDLHGAPGGQSKEHHTLRGGQNKLWSDPVNQRRTTEIWDALSKRYGGRPSVVAYDLLNEPWGDYQQDLRADMLKITADLYTAIRKNDKQTLILLPGLLNRGIEFYGDPRSRGWVNVGFTEHHYPGLFGDKGGEFAQSRKLDREFPATKAYLSKLKAAYLIGEFNVVNQSNGGDAMMRRYFDAIAANGWMATQWAYKMVKPEAGTGPDHWYLCTNADALPKVSVLTSSKEELEAFFKSMGTMPLVMHEGFRQAITAKVAPPVVFPTRTGFLTTTPTAPVPTGWMLTNVGAAKPAGGLLTAAVGSGQKFSSLSMAGGGDDIWTREDSFLFLSHPVAADFDLTVTANSMQESDQWAKAGLMVRRGTDAHAGHVFVNTFPSGHVALSTRTAAGEVMTEKNDGEAGTFPIRLRLVGHGGSVTASYARGTGPWTELGTRPLPTGSEPLSAGMAVCAHDSSVLNTVQFADFELK